MIGQMISHYKILEKLGEGGMGIVYKAHDTKLDRDVALKFLPSDLTRDEDAKGRFIHEAQAASAIQHSNICTIHDIDETEDGQLFIVMDYYDGETLKQKIKRGPISVDEAIGFTLQIAEGLQKAHEKGIMHRDVKPANIMITTDGIVKILDFGLAKLAGLSRLTRMGSTVGTAAYMSPEQARGDEVDCRTDLWSLGVVIYEMLSGQTPFRGDYEQVIIYSILNQQHMAVNALNPRIPVALAKIIDRCLEKDPLNRYNSVAEFADHLVEMRPGPKLLHILRRGLTYPKRVERLAKLSIALMAFLLLFLLFPPSRQILFRWLMVTATSQDRHIAVLPIRSIGADSLMIGSFAEGFFEYLTAELGELERFQDNLIVESTEQIRQWKVTTPEQASRYLNANLIFQPTLWIEGRKWNFILNLIDPKTYHTVGSKRILGQGSDFGLLQDSTIVLAMDLLKIELSPEQIPALRANKTTDSKAYVYYVQGLNYLRQYQSLKNLAIADTLLSKAIKEDTAYALAHAALGEIYWRMYENTKDTQYIALAVRYGLRSVDLGPELSATHTALGLIYNGTGNDEGSVREFEQAVDIDPKNANAFLGLAKTYDRGKKYQLAESTYRRAIEMNPSYWGGYNELGKFYRSRQQYDSAISQFRKVVELTPDNYRGYNNIGGCYIYLDRKEEAKAAFQQALERERAYSVCVNMGALLFKERSYDEAVRYYEEAIRINDKDFQVWLNLANAYNHAPSLQGKFKDTILRAIALAKGELAARPDNKMILILIAGCYSDIGDKKNSLEYGMRAYRADPADGEILFRLACVYEKVGDRSRALNTLRLSLANGYPLSVIEGEVELTELRADPLYRNMLNEIKRGK